MFERVGVGADAGGAEHHDRVAHIGAPQAREWIEIFGENAERARPQALHEFRVVVRQMRHAMAATLHDSPSTVERNASRPRGIDSSHATHPLPARIRYTEASGARCDSLDSLSRQFPWHW